MHRVISAKAEEGDRVEGSGKQDRAEKNTDRQGQNPCQKNVSHSGHLEAGVIGGHRAGDARGEDMGCADGQTKVVGDHDRAHGDGFGGGALCIGEVVLADFFAYGFHDALLADHGAESECESDSVFHPVGNVIGEFVCMACHGLLAFFNGGIDVQFAGLVEFGDGF